MPKGYFTFVLHSHLPWVLGHGRWPHGTDWLNEATAECYIPLLHQVNKLVDEGYRPRLNIGITPILQEQLQSPHFIKEFEYYVKNKVDVAENDIKEFSRKEQKGLLAVAKMWKEFYTQVDEDFRTKYQKNLITAFSQLQKQGHVEIITSAATHGYLPLLKYDRSINAQIKLGVTSYRKNFGRTPNGIWLPECAYRPSYTWIPPVGVDKTSYNRKGIDEVLSESYIRYFIVDSHLLKGGKAIGVYLARFKALKNLWRQYKREFAEIREDFKKSPHEVYLVSSNPHIRPVAVFTRDPQTATQVWSGESGYPGDRHYLDFHKKRFPGGLRYWCVTDPKIDLALKETYNPYVTGDRVKEHAQHFVSLIKNAAVHYYKENKKPAFICAPFDTELFGHWWFEGPQWIYSVLKIIEEDRELELATGTTILNLFEPNKIISLPEGSWGEGGYHYIWLNKWNDWTWQRIYEAEDKFFSLYDKFSKMPDEKIILILKQLCRELLLLQSSDWQFLISTWSARDYAENRFSRHFENFKYLAHVIEKEMIGQSDMNFVNDLEKQDSCFRDLDLSIFKE